MRVCRSDGEKLVVDGSVACRVSLYDASDDRKHSIGRLGVVMRVQHDIGDRKADAPVRENELSAGLLRDKVDKLVKCRKCRAVVRPVVLHRSDRDVPAEQLGCGFRAASNKRRENGSVLCAQLKHGSSKLMLDFVCVLVCEIELPQQFEHVSYTRDKHAGMLGDARDTQAAGEELDIMLELWRRARVVVVSNDVLDCSGNHI